MNTRSIADHRKLLLVELKDLGLIEFKLPESAIAKAGFAVLWLFIFVVYSRLTDLVLPGWHVADILGGAAILLAVAAGKLFLAFSDRITWWLLALTGWFMACIPFSFWKGGSFYLLRDTWSKVIIIFLLVASLTRAERQLWKLSVALGLSLTVVVALSGAFARTVEGIRLALVQGVLANPNEFAEVILFLIPFAGLAASRGNPFLRLLMGISILGGIYLVIKSGSRGGFLTLSVLILFWLIVAPLFHRILTVAVLFVGSFLVTSVMPQELLARIKLIFVGEHQPAVSETLSGAVESTLNRMKVLEEAWHLTIRHPVFGVGPGQFASAAAEFERQRGERPLWRETHNMYAQVAAEMGVPGFVLFVGLIFSSLRGTFKVRRLTRYWPAFDKLRPATTALTLAFVVFLVAGLFNAIAYRLYLPVLAGMVVGLKAAAKEIGLEVLSSAAASSAVEPGSGDRQLATTVSG